ncbi:NAD dependent epimerase/dehydratase family protein [Mycobacterium xenopi 3993]|nr:NAD dependent epimerase/dehydratase family protein [Mycobacterium xenopi 3993]
MRFFTGDVSHAPDWDAVLRLFQPRQIVHLAAETGTAQSLTEASRHGLVNVVGTAQLLDALTRSALVPDQLVLTSSRAVYGEGAWQSGSEVFYPRPVATLSCWLANGIRWDPPASPRYRCPAAQAVLNRDQPASTPPPSSPRSTC